MEPLVAYGNLPGKFPYKSSRGNQYILVAYHYDANMIQGKALRNREAGTIAEAYDKINDYLKKNWCTTVTLDIRQ